MSSFGPSFAIADTTIAFDFNVNDVYARTSRIVRSPVWNNRTATPQSSGSVWHLLSSYERFKDFAKIVYSSGLH